MPVLNWIGKDSVVTYHSKVPFRTLSLTYGYMAEHRREEGLSSESGNMIVFGDNLLSLKALLPRLEGQVKCIYNVFITILHITQVRSGSIQMIVMIHVLKLG